MMHDTIDVMDAPAGTLSAELQAIARSYLGARARAGEAILDAARYLADARAAARRGEWAMFLEATNTQADTATRLLQIASRAEIDEQYARAVSDGRLAFTAAWELLSASADVQQRVIESDTPTPVSVIRKAKSEEKLRTSAEFVPAPPLPPEDEQHRVTVEALLKEAAHAGERTGTTLYQQAYDHAAEIHDLDLHNKMIALINRATDEPPPPAASDRAAYEAKEERDSGRLLRARTLIGNGELEAARGVLDQIEVATWARDQLLATIPDVPDARTLARTFLAEQAARLPHFSPTAMISQTTFKEALGHIRALLDGTP